LSELPSNDGENSDDKQKEDELLSALAADMGNTEQQESWVMLNEVYRGLTGAGFTQAEALALLTNIMWKMMMEGGSS